MIVMRVLVAASLAMAGAFTAAADMNSAVLTGFNDAVSSGDPVRIEAASRALMAEAIANPDDPDALVAAYEAALKLCDTDCAAALPGAEFAVSFPDDGNHPIMSERQLLLAFARYKSRSTRGTRDALEAALHGITDPTMQSVSAYIVLYSEYFEDRQWDDVARIAANATAHMEPVQSSVLRLYYHSMQTAATASFLQEISADSHRALVVWHARTKQLHTTFRSQNVDIPDWLEDMRWHSEAWVLSADGFYNSFDQNLNGRRGFRTEVTELSQSETDAIYAQYPEPTVMIYRSTIDAALDDNRRHCPGNIVRPEMFRFPFRAAYTGQVGAVIMRLKMDDRGHVYDADILSSVPAGVFEETALAPVQTWYWQPNPGVDLTQCRLSHENSIQTVTFLIE